MEVNILQNRKITVKFVPEKSMESLPTNHPLYGGMMEGTTKSYCVPTDQKGDIKKVLEPEEEEFLEEALSLPKGALNRFNDTKNFWWTRYVELSKEPTILDLSNPNDYISYKILLANDMQIAPDLESYRQKKMPTYKFYISEGNEEAKETITKVSETERAWQNYTKVKNSYNKIKTAVRLISGRGLRDGFDLEEGQVALSSFIAKEAEKFNKVLEDKLFNTKVLINVAVENGALLNKGNFYFEVDKETGNTIPLCESKENPTFENAAKYLNTKKGQALLLLLQAKCKID